MIHFLFCTLWYNVYCRVYTAYTVNNISINHTCPECPLRPCWKLVLALYFESAIWFLPRAYCFLSGWSKKNTALPFRCNPFIHMVHLLQQALRLPLKSHKATAYQFVSCFLWSSTSWHVPYHTHYSRGYGTSHHAPYPLIRITTHWMLWRPPIKLQRRRET